MLRCDRILWRGDGITQLSYYRGESRFSDHRPVCGTFVVEVDVLNKKTKRRSSNADMRIGAEELLPMGKGKGNSIPTACTVIPSSIRYLDSSSNSDFTTLGNQET